MIAQEQILFLIFFQLPTSNFQLPTSNFQLPTIYPFEPLVLYDRDPALSLLI